MDAIGQLRASAPDRDFLLISHAISRTLYYSLSEELAARAQHRKCTLIITTYGGDPNAGFRIARSLRHHYPEHLRVVVPSWCKSAGTLVAIAADELAVGDFGELGPLDIQVQKGTELEERSSGLDILQALGAVTQHTQATFHAMLKETRGLGLSTRLSAEFASHISSAIASPLFAQIDPMRVGELQRAMDIANEYGKRLNEYGKNLKDDALRSLIEAYPSHGFVIDRKEAKQLFHRVGPLTDAENTFSRFYWPLLQYQNEVACLLLETPAKPTLDQDPDDAPPPSSSTDQQDDVQGHESGRGREDGSERSGPNSEGVRDSGKDPGSEGNQ